MATHDYVLANQSGSSFRTDLNNALAAIVSLNSSSSEPSTTYAFMLWVDTTNNKIKLRNSANNAWITLFTSTGGIEVAQDSSFDGDVTFSGANHNILWDKSADALEFADNAECRFGTGSDLKLFHDGSNSYIKHVGTDDLWIIGETDDVNIKAADNIILQPQNGENGVRIVGNDSVELYYDSTVRFNTNSAGATCHGNLTLTSSTDTVLQVETSGTGSGDDARIELITQESTFTIQNDRSLGSDGALTISPGSDNGIIIKKDSSIEIYHDNERVLWTDLNGINAQATGSKDFHFNFLSGGGNQWGIWNQDNNMRFMEDSTERMRIYSNGNIGAPTGSNIYNASDQRLKENITTLTNGLDKIKALNPVSFNWIDGFCEEEKDKTLYGVIAQEAQVVDSNLVNTFSTGKVTVKDQIIENTLTVNEKFIIPLLIKAVQELSEKVTALEAK